MTRLRNILPLLLLCLNISLNANEIDKCINSVLAEQNIISAGICSDEVFVRRTYIVLTGNLPTIEETKSFLKSKDRTALINKLLESNSFNENLALKWGDLLKIKSEFPSNIWPNGVQAYNKWISQKIAQNTTYDRFVYELLTGTGSNFRTPQVSFYRAFIERSPDVIAENVELLFLGKRKVDINTPQFFSQLRYKTTGEWKEEIVYIDRDIEPLSKSIKMNDGKILSLNKGDDFRKVYAQWLIKTPQFTSVIVNRVWFWIFRKGIVDAPDDFREDNKPSNPKLLDELSQYFIKNNYDIKSLYRYILSSDCYNRSSIPASENADENRYFSYFPTYRLTSEQIIDGISILTGVNDRYVSRVPEPYSYYPADMTSAQIGDATVSSPALELFGRPSRDYSLESDRSNTLNKKQTLYLLNSSTILEKIESSAKLTELVEKAESRKAIVNNIYLSTLSRMPSDNERELIISSLNDIKSKRIFASYVMWAIINSPEFIFNH